MKVHLVVGISQHGIPSVACGAWTGEDASLLRRHATCKNCRRTFAKRPAKKGRKR